MKNLKNVCKQTNLPFLILFSYLITCIYRVPNISESIIIIALCVLFGFKLWLDYNIKPDPAKELNERLKLIETAVGGLTLSATAKKVKTPVQNFGWHK